MGRPRKNPLPVTPSVDSSAECASVSVRSKSASFWRCSREFTKKATVFKAGELSDSDFARISADPNLIVEKV